MTDEDVTVTIKESWLKDMVDTHNKYTQLEAENQQLKELLKECRDDVNHIISNVHLCKELLDLKTKIDNVIGDKK